MAALGVYLGQFLQFLWLQDSLGHLLGPDQLLLNIFLMGPASLHKRSFWTVTISLRNLTLKTVFLVAVTSARRIGELHARSVKEPFLLICPDRIVLKTDPVFLPKVASVHNRSQPTFCSNPSGEKKDLLHNLDVRRIVLRYLEITRDFRSSDSLFFFSGNRNGCQASKGSIARWLKSSISEAYSQMGFFFSPPGIRALY